CFKLSGHLYCLMASGSDPWSDFPTTRNSIYTNTVDRLKQILNGLNEECSTHFSKSGRKQDIIERIQSTMDTWKANNMADKYSKARAVINQVRQSGTYTSFSTTPMMSPILPQTTYPNAAVPKPLVAATSFGANLSAIGRYDPYGPPRKPAATPSGAASKPALRFKESPFFQVDQAVSSVVECLESSSAVDRRQQSFTFNLTNDQIVKLNSESPKYQLRLFCTSSTFYNPTPSSFRPLTGPCLIEFPPTCEVRVNNVQITANLKGMKKKPGTAPPPDIGKFARITTASNKIEIVYVNSQQQQPSQPKKFYLVVQLVKTRTVESLIVDLKKTSYKSSEEIRREMQAGVSEDDDIVAGPQKMSLKCPLSYARVSTPCRSSKCPHPQCFDAAMWYSVMEQTSTWLCPVCERTLEPAELIVDGYFDEILKSSPDSVEDVIVEADGQWHSSDNKYGSAAWKAAHGPVPKPASPRKAVAVSPAKSSADRNLRRTTTEIVVLDSDDEDEGRVKRELSPSFASSSSAHRSSPHANDVIDLTLDSDDDDEALSIRTGMKRAASAVGLSAEPAWKKSRTSNLAFVSTPPSSSSSAEYNRLSSSGFSPRPAPLGSPGFGLTLPLPVQSLPRSGSTSSSPVPFPVPRRW
ncbi:unnamed protein product, partial [Mycena citricolor]